MVKKKLQSLENNFMNYDQPPRPNFPEQKKMQRIEDVSFEEVPRRTLDAIEVGVYKDDSEEIVLEKLKQELIRKNWWLQEEWKKEGLPKEQLIISAGDKNIELFNLVVSNF